MAEAGKHEIAIGEILNVTDNARSKKVISAYNPELKYKANLQNLKYQRATSVNRSQ